MFGDILHGTWLTVFAAYMVMTYKEGSQDLIGKARYLFLLMGLFATFCGFVYNDFTSLTTEMFGPGCYPKDLDEAIPKTNQIWAHQAEGCTYPFGFDPTWARSVQEIMFFNSFKMKISVIIGVAQMMLGTFCKGINAIYFRRPVEFIFVFISQVVLMVCLFGFMNYMIVVKWTTDWETLIAQYHKEHPSEP